jgi:hypothetical protein
MQNAINFFFISLLTVQLRGSNAHLSIALALVENINKSGNYLLPRNS